MVGTRVIQGKRAGTFEIALARLNLGHPVDGSIRRMLSFRRASEVAQLSHDQPCRDLAINDTRRAGCTSVYRFNNRE